MIGLSGEGSIRRIYLAYRPIWRWRVRASRLAEQGFKTALAFLLGAVAIAWKFVSVRLSLSRHFTSRQAKESPGKRGLSSLDTYYCSPAGYVIVKALGVSPLAVILGLFASTAAVVTSSIIELFESLFTRSTTR